MPLPQHTQQPNSRRNQFVRSSCDSSHAASAAMPSSHAAHSMTKEDLKAVVEKAKTCGDPTAYMKCVVTNYMISQSGRLGAQDCSQYCAPVESSAASMQADVQKRLKKGAHPAHLAHAATAYMKK